VVVPLWIWLVFIFALGCCVGSFLNVVIYRLPRDKSLIRPASACPACGEHIRFYDNIPLVSWLILRARCRYCKAPISARYFVIELLTGGVFVLLFVLYFVSEVRVFDINGHKGLSAFWQGGWFVYLLHIILLSALIASSAIDLELWVIPVVICWFAAILGVLGSGVGVFVISRAQFSGFYPLPSAGPKTAALAAGALIGLVISLILVGTGLIKRSYETDDEAEQAQEGKTEAEQAEPTFNHRAEMLKEIVFLAPIVICSIGSYWIIKLTNAAWWAGFASNPAVSGILGSLFGFFVGGGIIWATRILGTLGFGKEAMGLGDVHLMAAAGAIIGPLAVVAAFFVAPFFGLIWAGSQMFFKKIRQIPYGPFLSMGVFAVMILNDIIIEYWQAITLSPYK